MVRSKPIVLDTNYLVRLVVRDVPEQTSQVVKLLEAAPNNTLLVSDVVFAETVYVLEKVYGFERSVIVEALTFVIDHVAFDIAVDSLRKTLERYVANPKLSFMDCYTWTHSTKAQHELLTFDKELSKASQNLSR